MEAKTFEVRDAATFLPVLAVRLDPSCEADRYLLARSGYGSGYGREAEGQGDYVLLARLQGGTMHYDPHAWGSRTMQVAHEHLVSRWRELESGAVVDVEFILGETTAPKESEAAEAPE